METTRNFFTMLLSVLGVIFIFVIIVGAYIVIADPFGLKPMLFGSGAPSTAREVSMNTGTTTETGTPMVADTEGVIVLSEAQKEALRGLGIDPASLPTTISGAQATCFEEKLGTSRVVEIRAGAVPSAFELLRVKVCINN